MNFFDGFTGFLQKNFPSTFTIALFLTLLTFLLALFLTSPVDVAHSTKSVFHNISSDPLTNSNVHAIQLLSFWYDGMWNTNLLAFAVQMMLILVLGYALASTSFFEKLIQGALHYCTSTSRTALIVAFFTILLSYFNWGLGLIFGAIFARKAGEHASRLNIPINYPIIVAAGYSGLMVWHGGISGSAPLKVAEKGHFLALIGKDLPTVDFSQTIFSGMNIILSILLLAALPLSLYMLGRKSKKEIIFNFKEPESFKPQNTTDISGAEKFDHSTWAGSIIGITFLLIAIYKILIGGGLSVIDPNWLNFVLLGLGLLLSGRIAIFLTNIKNAMGTAAGILIQFPLYFGIMGIMKYSGLVELFSNYLISISNQTTFPLFTFLSAGLVNIFVPSGGGQWAVQGPIIVEAAQNLHVPLGKSIMALAYGDEITNMLQPFWALPLLGITGLKAKDIIPFTLYLMTIGTVVFIAGLLIFH